jgi:aryl sulfotransferase
MSDQTERAKQENQAAEEQGVPWVDPEIQQQIQWRDGDIVVSVPIKSGTTWTMNIVHQLRAGGDPDFEDVYLEVPWLELVPAPGSARDAIVAQFDAMPGHRRRAFKTHSPAGPLPYHAADSGPDVRYVVVVRNPDEAVASLYPFIASHSDAWFALWQIDKAELVPPDFATFFDAVAKPMVGGMLFGFVAAWWTLRHEPNVLLMHFSDMKRDHEGSVRKIAEFLHFEPSEAQWPVILECTSFRWMKQHEHKFEGRTVTGVPILNPGAMLRKGRVGAAREDGVTPEISAELARIGREIVSDDAAFDWAYRGGPVR